MDMNIFKTTDTFTKIKLFLQNLILMELIAQIAQNGSIHQKKAMNKDIQNQFKEIKFISLLLELLENTPTIFVIQILIQPRELFFTEKMSIMGLVSLL
jgi:hypothetical protein